MRCSASSRFVFTFRDTTSTYVRWYLCKIVINLLSELIFLQVKSRKYQGVFEVKSRLICIPNEIFIAKKLSFVVRLLYIVCIRSVLQLKYER